MAPDMPRKESATSVTNHNLHLFGLMCCNVLTLTELIAPLLWLLMTAVVLHWLPNVIATPPESDRKEIPSCRHRCALKQHYRKGTRRANAPQAGSIRSHGLHRKYPINLRSMGHCIRSNAPANPG
jgi:hypothetical protein